jgi:hypothetical protein
MGLDFIMAASTYVGMFVSHRIAARRVLSGGVWADF